MLKTEKKKKTGGTLPIKVTLYHIRGIYAKRKCILDAWAFVTRFLSIFSRKFVSTPQRSH